MNEIEISSIFHEVMLIISYVVGVFFSIQIGKQNHIRPVVTALLILITTVFYLFFYYYFMSHANQWFELLRPGFPHLDKSVGMFGIILGLIISGILLRIPYPVLYKFSLPVLIIYAISNLGCLGGKCLETHAGFFHFDTYQYLFRNGSTLFAAILDDRSRVQTLFKIIPGIGVAATLYLFRNRFWNPSNILFTAFSSMLLIIFVNQFFIQPVAGNSVFNRLLGLNIFQWAIAMVTFLALIYVFINESNRDHRNPRKRIKSPSDYKILILYLIILLTAFHDSSWISKTNPSIFVIGFSFTTFLLILYFHKRIRLYAIRYATILIILLAGILFLQTRFFSPQNQNPDVLNNPSERRLDREQVINQGRIVQRTPIEKEDLQFVEFHRLGHESLTQYPVHTFSDEVVDKYTDHPIQRENLVVP